MKLLATILILLTTTFAKATKIDFHPTGPAYGLFISGDPLNGAYYPVNPGDTIVLHNEYMWAYFVMEDYLVPHGSPNIVVMGDETGQTHLRDGMQYHNCEGIKVTGSNYGTYGLKIEAINPGFGIGFQVYGKSSRIICNKIYIHHVGYFTAFKNENSCDTTLDYMGFWSYRMDSCEVSECLMVNANQDGNYEGSTGQQPTDRPITCGGIVYYYIPMAISNFTFRDNIVDSCGRTGVQFGGLKFGYGRVYNNTFTRMGYEYNQAQGNAIAIGGYSQGMDIHNNTINLTFLYGIADFGTLVNKAYNNRIDSSGIIKWTDPYMNLDSFALANGMEVRGGLYLLNTYSHPVNILAVARATNNGIDSPTLKTVQYKTNQLGYNAATGTDSLGAISFFPTLGESWNTNNIVCNNTRIINGTPANVNQFNYDPGTGTVPWPLYSSDCSRVIKYFIRLKKGYRPNPITY